MKNAGLAGSLLSAAISCMGCGFVFVCIVLAAIAIAYGAGGR